MKVEVEHSGISVSIVVCGNASTTTSVAILGQVAERAIQDIVKNSNSEEMSIGSVEEDDDSDEDDDADEEDISDESYESDDEEDSEVIVYEGNRKIEQNIFKYIKSNNESLFLKELEEINGIIKIKGTTKEQRMWVFQIISEIHYIDVWSQLASGNRILFLKKKNKKIKKND